MRIILFVILTMLSCSLNSDDNLYYVNDFDVSRMAEKIKIDILDLSQSISVIKIPWRIIE